MKESVKKELIIAQKNEITEHYLYLKLAERSNAKNKKAFKCIAKEELEHYEFLKKLTKREVPPSPLKIGFFYTLARLAGMNFSVHLMELGEEHGLWRYTQLLKTLPELKPMLEQEKHHEKEILKMVDKGELQFTGSIVLGLNDALVELTGSLAGLTLAFQNTRLIAIAGFIVGIAASMSMAASEYLSKKEEGDHKPFKAATYTGIAYLIAVIILIAPFFLFTSAFAALTVTLLCGFLIIFMFTFYTAVAHNKSFKKRFLHMAVISLGVAALNFIIGYFVNKYLVSGI